MTRRELLKSAATGAAVAALGNSQAAAPVQPETGVPRHGIVSRRPAGFWEEALITGNGTMGALVMSGTTDETLILSHERLFLPIHEPLPPVHTAPHLPAIRRMMAEGRWQEAADFVVELSRREGYGSKRWTDPLFPACDLRLEMPRAGEPGGYLRSLDYRTGVARVRWTDSRGAFDRRVFVSRADNLVVVRLTSPVRRAVDVDLRLAQHDASEEGYWDAKGRRATGIWSFVALAEPAWLTCRSRYRLTSGGYIVLARVTPDGGRVSCAGDVMRVREADGVIITARIEPLVDYGRRDEDSMKRSIEAAGSDFRALLSRHEKEHGRIFGRVSLDLGGTDSDHARPSEELVEAARGGAVPSALLEKEFDEGRYAILSSCGELPPTLQGVWTGTFGPPWSSDYTQNGNVQSAMASALSGAMPECLLSYARYMEGLVPDGRTNARRLYGARGNLVASRTSSHGLNNHFDRTWPMTFWTAGAGWAAQFLYDYWLYTGDREFLRKRAWPYMTEAARFYEDFLFEGPDGRYVFSPSYSPENNPANVDSQACVNATMDIAVARELLTNCVAAAETLGIRDTRTRRWREMLAKLPDYETNADGAVKEWTWPGIEDNYAHRHCSHLYALFNYLPDDVEADPALIEAFRAAVRRRAGERRKEAGGGVMAFGLVQLGLSAATLGDSETVSFVIDRLSRHYYFSSLNTSHDPGSIFNTDLAGGLPAVIIKSLVNSKPGRIDLLPAVPAQMPKGRLTGTLLRGAIRLDVLEWAPGSVTAAMTSREKQPVTLRLPSPIVSFCVNGRELDIQPDSREAGVTLPKGRKVRVEARFGG